MHKTTGRWQLGLVLALTSTVFWGALPIALKALLDVMDAYTITWYRFVVAFFLLGAFLAQRRRLPGVSRLGGGRWLLLAVAIGGLCANYLFYVLGLAYISAGTAQIVIQLAPVFLLLGGLVFFRERFSGLQTAGLVVLVTGLGLFFNDRLGSVFSEIGDYALGVAWIFVSAIVWAAYALTQKQLLKDMTSNSILLLIYGAAVFVFLPTSNLTQIIELNGKELGLLLFCCVNTLMAYGCFAESLDHWEASRVSAVLAITPLLTFLFVAATTQLWPGLVPAEQLNSLSIAGAFIVVAGSMMTALGSRSDDKALTQPPD